jgi:predicted ATPase
MVAAIKLATLNRKGRHLSTAKAIAELPEEALHRSLGHLQASEFLYETRLFPDIEYTFKHALTQQVAYETLPQEWRRALHARIVEALEALAGDRMAEQVERLAHHALRGKVWDKAVTYGQQAGARARARAAFREAVAASEQALQIGDCPAFARGAEGNVQLSFGDIDTNKNLGRHTDSSWPSLARYGL